ncbi:MAG: glycosyltransferase family 2 protein [Nitritalea sp.]
MSPSPSPYPQSPLVSIILISYRQEDFIEAALRSILALDYPHLELLLADDASPDATAARAKALLDAFPPKPGFSYRILPRPKNLGLTANVADALRQARGTYCHILGGDDYFCLPSKLNLQVLELEQDPLLMACFTDYRIIDAQDHTMEAQALRAKGLNAPKRFSIEALYSGASAYVLSQTTLFRREALDSTFFDLLTDPRTLIEDFPLILHLGFQGDFLFLPLVGSAYRYHTGSMTGGIDHQRNWRLHLSHKFVRESLYARYGRALKGHAAMQVEIAKEELLLATKSLQQPPEGEAAYRLLKERGALTMKLRGLYLLYRLPFLLRLALRLKNALR